MDSVCTRQTNCLYQIILCLFIITTLLTLQFNNREFTNMQNKVANSKFNTNYAMEFMPSIYKPSQFARSSNEIINRKAQFTFEERRWQTLETPNGTIIYVFGAYYDDRFTTPVIRVLTMIDKSNPTDQIYCAFHHWDEPANKVAAVPQPVAICDYKYIWNKKWGILKSVKELLHPYLITCSLESSNKSQPVNFVPKSITLFPNQNKTVSKSIANSHLNVIHNKLPENENKQMFAVCIKGLDFPNEDISGRLIEWIELIHLLGADQIYFYVLHVHSNVSKVLNYYEEKKKVKVTRIKLPGSQPNANPSQHLYLKRNVDAKRRNELIPYNDCLYQNMYKYKWLILIDIDEVIMPVKHANWIRLMKYAMDTMGNRIVDSFSVRNVYFLDVNNRSTGLWVNNSGPNGVQKYMHMVNHIYRSRYFTSPTEYVKCFHNTERILLLHNHFPLACEQGFCQSYSMPTFIAQLQHYRSECVNSLRDKCDHFKENRVKDSNIEPFKDTLIKRTEIVMNSLKLI